MLSCLIPFRVHICTSFRKAHPKWPQARRPCDDGSLGGVYRFSCALLASKVGGAAIAIAAFARSRHEKEQQEAGRQGLWPVGCQARVAADLYRRFFNAELSRAQLGHPKPWLLNAVQSAIHLKYIYITFVWLRLNIARLRNLTIMMT